MGSIAETKDVGQHSWLDADPVVLDLDLSVF